MFLISSELRILCPEPGTCKGNTFLFAECIGKINLTEKAPDSIAGIFLKWDIRPHTFINKGEAL